ncbi:TauD/TfdA family dioxygenase [Bacillus sp. F19]|nr:TauD/TfdA family dioxygenase [Bacillus sp. F19]
MSEKTIATLETALFHVKQKGLQAPNFNKEDFLIPELSDETAYFIDELEYGRGFLLIRGLPMERYTDEEASIIYWGLGADFAMFIDEKTAKADRGGITVKKQLAILKNTCG